MSSRTLLVSSHPGTFDWGDYALFDRARNTLPVSVGIELAPSERDTTPERLKVKGVVFTHLRQHRGKSVPALLVRIDTDLTNWARRKVGCFSHKTAHHPCVVANGPQVLRVCVNGKVAGVCERNIDDPCTRRFNHRVVRMGCTLEYATATAIRSKL